MFELIKNHRELNYIDNLFNELTYNSFLPNVVNSHFSDLYMSDDENLYYVELALPGLEKKDVSLNISDNYLYLNYESTNDNNKPHWKKSFNRRIKLPSDIKIDSSEAELKNGVLSIKIQKDNSKNSHKINIK
tara:strand:+ start:1306 stop:1701 length:396 start_codon:yes stop_codon:yes gene_type:complete